MLYLAKKAATESVKSVRYFLIILWPTFGAYVSP